MGGAGLYAALGARLAASHQHAKAVSFIIDKGSDFPAEFQALIDSWHTSALFRTDLTRLTTRAWNGYGPKQHRGKFPSLSKPLRPPRPPRVRHPPSLLRPTSRLQIPHPQAAPRSYLPDGRPDLSDDVPHGLLAHSLHNPGP